MSHVRTTLLSYRVACVTGVNYRGRYVRTHVCNSNINTYLTVCETEEFLRRAILEERPKMRYLYNFTTVQFIVSALCLCNDGTYLR